MKIKLQVTPGLNYARATWFLKPEYRPSPLEKMPTAFLRYHAPAVPPSIPFEAL